MGPDLHALNLSLLDANGKTIAGLTDVNIPKRHVPKRARKIRRVLGIPKKLDPKQMGIICKAHYAAFAR